MGLVIGLVRAKIKECTKECGDAFPVYYKSGVANCLYIYVQESNCLYLYEGLQL